MNLLNCIEYHKMCPVCDKELSITLRISYDDYSKVDYTLVKCEYPLMFSKQLEFGDIPREISIPSYDVLDCGQQIRSASMYVNCKNHYSCNIFTISTKSRSPEIMFNR